MTANNVPLAEIGRRYSISFQTLSQIRGGRRYSKRVSKAEAFELDNFTQIEDLVDLVKTWADRQEHTFSLAELKRYLEDEWNLFINEKQLREVLKRRCGYSFK